MGYTVKLFCGKDLEFIAEGCDRSFVTSALVWHDQSSPVDRSVRVPNTGPVRTVTRQEIIPGTYDGVVVMGVDPGGELHVSLIPMATRDPDRLERAAAVLTALAGALRDEH